MRRSIITVAAAVLLSAQPALARQHGHSSQPKPGGSTSHPTTAHAQTTHAQPGPSTHGPSTQGAHATSAKGLQSTHGGSHAPSKPATPKIQSGAAPAKGSTKNPTKPASTKSGSTKETPTKGTSTKAATDKSAKSSTASSVTTSTTTSGVAAGSGVTLTPVQQKLQKNTNLASKLQNRLPMGTDLMEAAAGFRNLGQFVAAVNVSNNLGISFDKLKASMVDDGLSLEQSIQAVKPTAHGSVEAERAELDARVLIQQTETTTTTTGAVTTTTATKKPKKTTGGSRE